MDVSAHALADLSRRFDTVPPRMAIEPVLGDYFEHWPQVAEGRRQVAMLLGGLNGQPGRTRCRQAAAASLAFEFAPGYHAACYRLRIWSRTRPCCAQPDDSQGVTAAFNLNLLTRLIASWAWTSILPKFRHYATTVRWNTWPGSFLITQVDHVVNGRNPRPRFRFSLPADHLYDGAIFSEEFTIGFILNTSQPKAGLTTPAAPDRPPRLVTPSPSGTATVHPNATNVDLKKES